MRKIILFSLIVTLSICLFGCLVDITSITVPGATNIHKVITFTVNASATKNGTSYRNGIIFQIPSGTEVLRVAYYTSTGPHSGFLLEDTGILTGYTPEPGYELYGAVADFGVDQDSSVIFTVWLAVPDGVAPGTYTIKAATGGYVITDITNTWIPQYPQNRGTPIMNFSLISGNYVSNAFTIYAGMTDTTPPADVTPIVQNGCEESIDISGYNEPLQGDVAKYRVFVSDTSFASTIGGMLLDATTSPSVYGNEDNFVSLSSSLGPGLFYFEVPPGSQFPISIAGLSLMEATLYFAVTAVDLSNNESSPIVVPTPTPVHCATLPIEVREYDIVNDDYIYYYYSDVQSAYNAVVNNFNLDPLIKLQALDFPNESPNFGQNIDVIISGGYDCCYDDFNDQYSTINGTLTISAGTVTVENLVLK